MIFVLEASYVPKGAFNAHDVDQYQTCGKLTLLAEKSGEEEGEREDVIHSAFFTNIRKVS